MPPCINQFLRKLCWIWVKPHQPSVDIRLGDGPLAAALDYLLCRLLVAGDIHFPESDPVPAEVCL